MITYPNTSNNIIQHKVYTNYAKSNYLYSVTWYDRQSYVEQGKMRKLFHVMLHVDFLSPLLCLFINVRHQITYQRQAKSRNICTRT
jgi:hypothetical protein